MTIFKAGRAALSILLLSGLIAFAGNAHASDLDIAKRQQQIIEINHYLARHPGDFIGYERLARSAGADRIIFTAPKVGLRNASPEKIQRAYDQLTSREAAPKSVSPLSGIPSNAFSVLDWWTHYQANPRFGLPEYWSLNGDVEFNQNIVYQGAGAPEDVSGLATDNVDASCWKLDVDGTDGYYYVNNQYTEFHNLYRYDASFNHTVWKIEDESHLDTGIIPSNLDTYMIYKPAGNDIIVSESCRQKIMAANYYFNHNHEGTTIAGISISIGVMSVSFGGDSDPLELQKSAGVTNSYYD